MSDELVEVLASCIEGIEAEGQSVEDCLTKHPSYQKELEPLLRAVVELRTARTLQVSDRFRRNASARLKLRLPASQRPPHLESVSDSAPLRYRLQTWIPSRLRSLPVIPTIVSIVLVLALSMAGLVTAADAAGPGDLLFGLDLAVEEFRLQLTSDEEAEAKLRLEFASERISEAEFELEVEGDIQDIEAALAALDEAIAGLRPLLDQLTLEQQAGIQEAIDSLNTVRGDIVRLEIEIKGGELELELESEEEDPDEGDELEDDDEDLEDHNENEIEDDEGEEACEPDEEDEEDDEGDDDDDDGEEVDDDGDDDGEDAGDDDDGEDTDDDDDGEDCGDDDEE
jgi:hypothetical protein